MNTLESHAAGLRQELRVLVPLDGSPLAERALDYLGTLSALGKLRIRLLGVVDEAGDTSGIRPLEEFVQRQVNLFEVYLQRRCDELLVRFDCDQMMVHGRPALAIVNAAGAFKADLIVMTSHGRTGVQRWRLGSVADKVVRSVACNVLVVSAHTDAILPQKLLTPLDGSALAEQALPLAKRIATGTGAELHIVRVVQPPIVGETAYGASTADLLALMVESSGAYLSGIKEELGADKATSIVGTPADALIEYSRENGIGLVVMTSHGRGGVVRSILGSVTGRLLGGPSPVLIVQPKSDGP